MGFKDEYTNDSTKSGEENKIQITQEAFAIGEMLEKILNALLRNK